jgi:hypothetical protein
VYDAHTLRHLHDTGDSEPGEVFVSCEHPSGPHGVAMMAIPSGRQGICVTHTPPPAASCSPRSSHRHRRALDMDPGEGMSADCNITEL